MHILIKLFVLSIQQREWLCQADGNVSTFGCLSYAICCKRPFNHTLRTLSWP